MRTYTVWLPLGLTVILVVIYILLPKQPQLLGDKGMVQGLLSIVSTLPGFYFAGLAAVATFGNGSMDSEMPAPAPEIDLEVSGAHVPVKLTRRLFLSYLFSYLVILSLVICFTLLAMNSCIQSILYLKHYIIDVRHIELAWDCIKSLVGVVVTFSLSSMLFSTLHGVFFLTEKIHQP